MKFKNNASLFLLTLLAIAHPLASTENWKQIASVERPLNPVPYTQMLHNQEVKLPAAQHHITVSPEALVALQKTFTKEQSQEFARGILLAKEQKQSKNTPDTAPLQHVVGKLFEIFDAGVSTTLLLELPDPQSNIHITCVFMIDSAQNSVSTLAINVRSLTATVAPYAVSLLKAVSTPDGFCFRNRKVLLGLTAAGLVGLTLKGPAIMRKRAPQYPVTSFNQTAFEQFVTDFSKSLATENKLAEYNIHTDILRLETTKPIIPALQGTYDSTWQRVAPVSEIPTNKPLVVIAAPYKNSITALAKQGRLTGNTDKKQLRILVTLLSTFSAQEVHKHCKLLTANNWIIVTINDSEKSYSNTDGSKLTQNDLHAIWKNGSAYSYFENPLPTWYFVATNPTKLDASPTGHLVYRVTGANMHRRHETRYYGNTTEYITHYDPDYAFTRRYAPTETPQPWLAATTVIEGNASFFEYIQDWGHLEILGLQPGATYEQIKQARKARAIATHSDKKPGADDERFKLVQNAFEALMKKYQSLAKTVDDETRKSFEENLTTSISGAQLTFTRNLSADIGLCSDKKLRIFIAYASDILAQPALNDSLLKDVPEFVFALGDKDKISFFSLVIINDLAEQIKPVAADLLRNKVRSIFNNFVICADRLIVDDVKTTTFTPYGQEAEQRTATFTTERSFAQAISWIITKQYLRVPTPRSSATTGSPAGDHTGSGRRSPVKSSHKPQHAVDKDGNMLDLSGKIESFEFEKNLKQSLAGVEDFWFEFTIGLSVRVSNRIALDKGIPNAEVSKYIFITFASSLLADDPLEFDEEQTKSLTSGLYRLVIINDLATEIDQQIYDLLAAKKIHIFSSLLLFVSPINSIAQTIQKITFYAKEKTSLFTSLSKTYAPPVEHAAGIADIIHSYGSDGLTEHLTKIPGSQMDKMD